MKLIDLSQPLYDAAPNCPAHPPVKATIIADHPDAGWRMELLTLASHTGSHVDAPLHKIAGGRCLDDLPLDTWVGQAWIADLRDSGDDRPITPADLQKSLADRRLEDHIVLLATGFGDRRAKTDSWLHHPARLTPEGAQWLVDQGVRGVGIDHYSIGGGGEANERTHTALLEAGVWIVEELRFPPEAFEAPAPAEFWCLPINFRGFSGAFCRPVLVVR